MPSKPRRQTNKGTYGKTLNREAERTMQAIMAERIRLIIDTDEVTRRAVRIRAARKGKTPSELLTELVREHYAREVKEAEQEIEQEVAEASKKTGKGK